MTPFFLLGSWVALSFFVTPIIGAVISRRVHDAPLLLDQDCAIAWQSGFPETAAIHRHV